MVRLTESDLHRIIKESVNKILKEGMKSTDENNIVPEDLAIKYGFKLDYSGFPNGLELWRKTIYKFEAGEYLRVLGIREFTSWHVVGKDKLGIRITVQPKPKQQQKQYGYM